MDLSSSAFVVEEGNRQACAQGGKFCWEEAESSSGSSKAARGREAESVGLRSPGASGPNPLSAFSHPPSALCALRSTDRNKRIQWPKPNLWLAGAQL